MLGENRGGNEFGTVYALQIEAIFDDFFVTFELFVLLFKDLAPHLHAVDCS